MICLPSKSTHLLQPLDIKCFALPQRTHERNLSMWLSCNPYLGISKIDFLDILQKTRKQVFMIDIIQTAWKLARCWPIDRAIPSLPPTTSDVSIANAVSVAVSGSVIDTPVRLRKLSQKVEAMLRVKLDDENRNMVHQLMNLYVEKIMQYRDIAPCAETLKKLPDGKVRRERKRTRHVSEARVLNAQYVNDGLKKIADAEAAKVEKHWVMQEKKRIAEEKKAAKEMLDKQ